MIVFIEIVGELLITIVIELVADLVFWVVPEKKDSKIVKICIGWSFALLGVILGFLSTLIIPNLLIKKDILQAANIIVSPILIGLLLSHWGKKRTQKGKRIGKVDKFFYGYLFALMVTLSRFIYSS